MEGRFEKLRVRRTIRPGTVKVCAGSVPKEAARGGTRRTGGSAAATSIVRALLVPPGLLAVTAAGPSGSPGGRRKEIRASATDEKKAEGTWRPTTLTEVTGPRFDPERVTAGVGTPATGTLGGSREARTGAAGRAIAIGQAFESVEPVVPGTFTRRSPLTGIGARPGIAREIDVPPPVESSGPTIRGVGMPVAPVNQTSFPEGAKLTPAIAIVAPGAAAPETPLIRGLPGSAAPDTAFAPSPSSVAIDRSATPLPRTAGNIVAPGSPLCPRPRAWPSSWTATPWMSKPAIPPPGPSSQVHWASSKKICQSVLG